MVLVLRTATTVVITKHVINKYQREVEALEALACAVIIVEKERRKK